MKDEVHVYAAEGLKIQKVMKGTTKIIVGESAILLIIEGKGKILKNKEKMDYANKEVLYLSAGKYEIQ